VSSRAATTVITPIGTNVALTTALIQVIGSNPTRRGLMFHNPNTNNLIVQIGTATLLILPASYSPLFSGDSLCTAAASAQMVTSTGNIAILEWQ
jgi:hypothetical protein